MDAPRLPATLVECPELPTEASVWQTPERILPPILLKQKVPLELKFEIGKISTDGNLKILITTVLKKRYL